MKDGMMRKRIALFLAAVLIALPFNDVFPYAGEETVSGNKSISWNESVSGDETVSGDKSVSGDESVSGNENASGDESVSGNKDVSEDESQPVPYLVSETEEIISETVKVRSLSSDFTAPSAFLTENKITFYAADNTVRGYTYLVVNVDGDYEISGLDSAGGLDFSAARVSYNGLPAFHITVSGDSAVNKSTIKKDIVLEDRKSGKQTKPVRLTVITGKKFPEPEWKKSLVTINASDKSGFAVNSPNRSGISIAPVSSNRYKSVIPKALNVTLLNENTVKIKAGKGMKLNKPYQVQLWLINTESPDAKAVKKKFTVKLTDMATFVSYKKAADSSLDLVSRSATALHYRPVIKNTGMVLNDICFKNPSMSENYVLQKEYDPGTGEITDIFVRAKDGAAITGGKTEFSFESILGQAGTDSGNIKKVSTVRAGKKTTRIRTAFVGGNKLRISEALSDNNIAGTFEIRVTSPKFGKIDPKTIKDLNKGLCTAYWTVDKYGSVARVKVVINKGKLVSRKNYNFSFSFKAVGAPASAKPTKFTLKYKAP